MKNREEVIDSILVDYLRRCDAGENPDPNRLIAQHPGFADELQSFFRMSRLVDQAIATPDTKRAVSGSTAPISPALPPGFICLTQLGRGGMGIVYGAIQTELGRRVALKALPPAFAREPSHLARFRFEAIACSQLNSNRILPIHEIVEHDGVPFIVTPWVDGADLGKILEQRKSSDRIPADGACHPLVTAEEQDYLLAVLSIADQVIEATVAIHEKGIVHRDIKPSNILVSLRNECWLSDFGLAKLLDATGFTAHGDVLGTRGYMSPEQSSGGPNIDGRADVYSLGVSIYHALTLHLPYGKEAVSETAVLPPAPSRIQRLISPDFDAVILKAIEPRREDRYASAEEFQTDWLRVRKGLLPHARPITHLRRTGRWLNRRRWLIATGVTSLTSLGLAAQMLPARAESYRVDVPTNPKAARGVMIPIDPDSGELRVDEGLYSAGESDEGLFFISVPPGDYFVAVETSDNRFHEVMRRVPFQEEQSVTFRHRSWDWRGRDVVRVHEIKIPPLNITEGMAYLSGAKSFMVGMSDPVMVALSQHDRVIPPFFMDVRSVTLQECVAAGMQHLLPRRALDDTEDLPVTSVSYDQAVEYAEIFGKRLPTEFEYEFAATNGGTTAFPWGDDASKARTEFFDARASAPHDATLGHPPILGLFSGAAEWTTSWGMPYPSSPEVVKQVFRSAPDFRELRVIRGGSEQVATGIVQGEDRDLPLGPRYRLLHYRSESLPGVGFRCVRSKTPGIANP